MNRVWLPILLGAALSSAARADFQLLVLENGVAQTPPPLYDLGAVAPGDVATARFRLRNQSDAPASLTYLEVRGTGFAPRNPVALPVTLAGQAAVDFTVTFSAPDAGGYSAALVSEGIWVVLAATVKPGIPFPAPRLAVHLPRAQSTQQGSAVVMFDAPAPRGGSGTLTLDFQSAVPGTTDAAIAFASGGRGAEFTFARGDSQAQFGNAAAAALFQTGTTAGRLTLAAQIGGTSDEAAIAIPAEPIGITAVQATRSGTSLDVRVTGFDNTRTAGPLAFTFFDRLGNAIAPGTMQTDVSTNFQQFYESSDQGGAFLLRAVFPVTGDTSLITEFEVTLNNSTGVAANSRAQF
jgi:hypothetical protein